MKKITLSIIALTFLSNAPIAQAQSNVTLYGIVDLGVAWIHGNNGEANNQFALLSSPFSGSRFGLKGTEELGNGLRGIFQLESGFNVANGNLGKTDTMFSRLAFVGLQSNELGTITLGRQWDPVTDLVQPITMDNFYGGYFATPGDIDNNDNSAGFNNSVKYTSPNLYGLKFSAMYAFSNLAGKNGQGSSWGVAANYTYKSFGIAAGYLSMRNPNTDTPRTQWNDASTDANFAGPVNNAFSTASSVDIAQVAGQYQFGDFIFGLGYSHAEYKPDGFSLFQEKQKYNTGRAYVVYHLTPAAAMGLSYIYTKANGNSDAKYNQFSLGANYSLSKRTDIYILSAYQKASGQQLTIQNGNATLSDAQASIGSSGWAGTNKQAFVATGVRHRF